MTREESIRHIEAAKLMLLGKDNQPISDLYYALDMAIKALEQKPSGDAISREQLLNKAYVLSDISANRDHINYDVVNVNDIKNAPPVNPQPKTDMLNKIRAEIDDLERHYDNDYFSGNKDAMFICSEVLDILDKYKAESEE